MTAMGCFTLLWIPQYWKRSNAETLATPCTNSKDNVMKDSNDSQTSDCSMDLGSSQIVDTGDEWNEMVLDESEHPTTNANVQGKHGAEIVKEKGRLDIATGNLGCCVFGGNLPLTQMHVAMVGNLTRRVSIRTLFLLPKT